jgi:hypothetical protein
VTEWNKGVRTEAARQEAIRAAADKLFHGLTTEIEEFEVVIGPHEVVEMLNGFLSTFESRGLLRDKVSISPTDINHVMSRFLETFQSLSLIERE